MADLYGPIQSRIDTAANWSSENPTLLAGEIGIARHPDGGLRFKVGDGSTAWNSLPSGPNEVGHAGLDVDRSFGSASGTQPGVFVAGETKDGGQFQISRLSGAYRSGGFIGGYAKGAGATIGTRYGSPFYGLAIGSAIAAEGAASIEARWSGGSLGGLWHDGPGYAKIISGTGLASGYAANWGGQSTARETFIRAEWAGFANGYALYGGRILAYNYATALGVAKGPGALIYGNTAGLAAGYAMTTYPDPDSTETAQILASGKGAAAFGYVNAANGETSRIQALNYGSLAGGVVWTGSVIESTSDGAFAWGRAAAGGQIRASDPGAFALGFADDGGTIHADGAGGFAMGEVGNDAEIFAGAGGSFALGATTSTDIRAEAANTIQLGPGTNDVAGSLSVYAGPRLNGNGAPVTPRNGDIWVASNYVYIRSNGVSVKIT